jgi:hypothetical protein
MIVEVSEKIGRLKMIKGAWKNNISNFIYINWKQICVHLRSSVVCFSKYYKNRLNTEDSESVTYCHRLKMEAADRKQYLTEVADPETLLRLIQSVPWQEARFCFVKRHGG